MLIDGRLCTFAPLWDYYWKIFP